MDNENKDEAQKLKDLLAQKKVVNAIIDKGINFKVEYTVKVRQKGLFGFFKQKVYEKRSEEFVMKQATLDTLDRATAVKLRMKADLDRLDKEGVDKELETDKLAKAHAHDMAECLAIMVLGERYNAVEGGDDKELARLTELFYKTVTPSQYNDLENFINATRNLVDFVSSMRLTMMSMTTTPTERIE